jgi:tetratricopeptide (TPR) repeat protein
VLCGAAAWFVSIPRKDIGMWSLDHYKAGIRATEAAQIEQRAMRFTSAEDALDRAQRNLETAYRYVQTNAEINFALGNLWLARSYQPSIGENTKRDYRNRAIQFYGHTLSLDPRHSAACNNLGILYMGEKRWSDAERFLSKAITIEPKDAKAHYLLALTLKEEAKLDEARAEVEKALRLRPTDKQIQALRDQLAAPGAPTPAPQTPGS